MNKGLLTNLAIVRTVSSKIEKQMVCKSVKVHVKENSQKDVYTKII